MKFNGLFYFEKSAGMKDILLFFMGLGVGYNQICMMRKIIRSMYLLISLDRTEATEAYCKSIVEQVGAHRG